MEETIIQNWVGGVCVREDKVLLIHRINKASDFTKEYFVFPGKIVEGDEALESALEQAFSDYSITIKLQDLLYSKENDSNDIEYYYLCDYVLGEPAVREGSNEAIEMEGGEQVYTPMWIKLSELEDLIIYPESVKMSLLEIVFPDSY